MSVKYNQIYMGTEMTIQCSSEIDGKKGNHTHQATVLPKLIGGLEARTLKATDSYLGYGMLMALHEIGRGPTHAETILRFLEIPAKAIGYHYANIRRKISSLIQETTDISVARCLDLEKLMTTASEESEPVEYDERGNIGIAASMDMHWQIRKDSPSGATYLVGQLSRKVISRHIFSRSCRICFSHQKKQQSGEVDAEEEAPEHDCKMNYLPTYSSKGMEAKAALEICSKLPESSCYLAKLVIDDDTATLSKLREQLPEWMTRPTKYADRNHRVRGFGHQV